MAFSLPESETQLCLNQGSQAKIRHITSVQQAALLAIDATDAVQLAMSILNLLRETLPLDAFLFIDYDPDTRKLVDILQADTMDGKLEAWTTLESHTTHSDPLLQRVHDDKPALELRKPGEQIATDLYPFGNTSRRSASLMFAPMRYQGRKKGILSEIGRASCRERV